jgi:hypothetical protein
VLRLDPNAENAAGDLGPRIVPQPHFEQSRQGTGQTLNFVVAATRPSVARRIAVAELVGRGF